VRFPNSISTLFLPVQAYLFLLDKHITFFSVGLGMHTQVLKDLLRTICQLEVVSFFWLEQHVIKG
jgi:hypothetical protein